MKFSLYLSGMFLLSLSACGAAPDQASLDSVEQKLTGCPGNRAQQAGTVQSGAYLCSTWQSATQGQRHYVKMVGVRSSGKADLYVERASQPGVWVKQSVTANTSTEVIDWAIPTTDNYRVCAYGNGDYDTVRFTSDLTSTGTCGAVGSPVDFCFGAVGSNCSGVAVTSPCSTNSDATVTCQVSVGAQMHDTCCSHNPLGSSCNGAACNAGTSGTNCGWNSDCSAEYSHAQNDVTTTRQYPRVFDPTEPNYRPVDLATMDQTDKNRSTPTSSAIKTPVGKALWDVDASRGWCQNPSNYKTYWSLQGNYAVCCTTANSGC